MAGHSPGIALPHDPETGRRLLAEAGYPCGRGFPPVAYLEMPFSVYSELGEFLRQGWQEELGVEVTAETVESGTYTAIAERLGGEPPDLFGWGWVADYSDPDNFLRVFFATVPTGWRNPTYEGLIEKARRLTDQRERMKLYSQADRILVEDATIVPVCYNRNTVLVKPWVRKFPMSPRGGWFWKDVVIEPH
jgi:ABC-type transport system substrate-binding protein